MILEMLKGLSPSEKRQMLENHAEEIQQNFSYMTPLADEAIDAERQNLEQLSLTLSDMEEQLKEHTAMMRERIKSVKSDLYLSLQKLRTKAEHSTGDVFIIADHETNRMLYVSPEGHVVTTRPMLPAERQRNMFNIKNAM